MACGSDLPAFVDAHVHLWNLADAQLAFDWLHAPDDGALGPMAEIQIPLWDAARFRREVRHANVVGTVALPASDGGDSLPETAWLHAEHERAGWPDAIVARVDLRAGDVGAQLDRHLAASPLVRGARDMTLPGGFDDPALRAGLEQLRQRRLSWDLHCYWEDMPAASRLAAELPDLRIVLGHAGFPLERSERYFADWTHGMRALSAAPNVHCKISGLGMGDRDWTVASWRPWVLGAIDAFGVDRCFFGANWPVDRLYASYDAVLVALLGIVSDFSEDERTALFSDNARRFYRIQ